MYFLHACPPVTTTPSFPAGEEYTLTKLLNPRSACPTSIGERVFVAWGFGNSAIRDTLKELRTSFGPDRFHALGLDGKVSVIFEDLVWDGIRNADRLLAIFGDNPNVNVGFELGLALGLGKRISAICWSEERPDWMRRTLLSPFFTKAIRDASLIREFIEKEESWFPPNNSSSNPFPSIGKRLILAPTQLGPWRSYWNRLPVPNWDLIETVRKHSLNNLKDLCPDLGQIAWVVAPNDGEDVEGEGVEVNNWENTDNAILAGWVLGRSLAGRQKEISSENLKRTIEKDNCFHVFSIRPAKLATDLVTFSNEVSSPDLLTSKLSSIQPREIAPLVTDLSRYSTVELRNEKPLDSLMVQLIVTSLHRPHSLQGISREKRGECSGRRKMVRDILRLSEREVTQLAFLRTPEFPLVRDRLRELCAHYHLLRPGKFNDFIDTPREATRKWPDFHLSCVNEASAGGAALAYEIRCRVRQEQLPTICRKQIEDQLSKLGSSAPWEQYNALEEIYLRFSYSFGRTDNILQTVTDFGKEMWGRFVVESQEVSERATHLHHANEMFRIWFARLFEARFREEEVHLGKIHTVRLLEGGVGGCNTTHQVLLGIENGFRAAGGDPCNLRFIYRGYELNPQFSDAANRILRGEAVHTVQELGVLDSDPRVKFFAERRNRFSTFGGASEFVYWSEMDAGIGELFEDEDSHGKFDVFFCSYALHHVPNGVRLREYLFTGQRSVGTPLSRFATAGTSVRERFKSEVLAQLDNPGVTDMTLPLARVFWEHLGRFGRPESRFLRSALQAFRPGDVRPWECPAELQNLIEDRQSVVLLHVRELLSPGGLIGIADPDGYSTFNLQNVPKNVEMAVAHFRTRNEMAEILFDLLKFIEIQRWTQIRARGTNGKVEHGLGDTARAFTELRPNDELDDGNLGYILLGMKPSLDPQ